MKLEINIYNKKSNNMKHLKEFKIFNINENNKKTFRYLNLEKLPNKLKISLNEDGYNYIKDENIDIEESDYQKLQSLFDDLFDDVQGNSDYQYIENVGDFGFGLTEAPGITDGYYYDDNGDFKEIDETSELYYYEPYQIRDFVKELLKNGEVIFNKA